MAPASAKALRSARASARDSQPSAPESGRALARAVEAAVCPSATDSEQEQVSATPRPSATARAPESQCRSESRSRRGWTKAAPLAHRSAKAPARRSPQRSESVWARATVQQEPETQ